MAAVTGIMYNIFLYGIALAFSLLVSEILRRSDQSEVIGQLLVGVLLGPYIIGLIKPNEFFTFLSEIGALTLLFIAGLETDFSFLRKAGPSALLLASGGLFFTSTIAFSVIYYLSRDLHLALFLSVVLGATSISLTVRILDEFGKLRTSLAQTIVIAAVFDDLMVIFLIVIIIDIIKVGSLSLNNLFLMLGKLAILFALTIFLIVIFMKWIGSHLHKFKSRGGLLIFGFSFALLYSYISGSLGFSPIIGGYFAGMILAETDVEPDLLEGISPLAYVTVPIFLVNIGLKFNLSIIGDALIIGGLLSIIAVTGKILGGFTATLFKIRKIKKAIVLGVSQMPRAEVVLIFAGIGLEMGLLSDLWFSSLVIVMITTTFLTPIILKYLLKRGAFQDDNVH